MNNNGIHHRDAQAANPGIPTLPSGGKERDGREGRRMSSGSSVSNLIANPLAATRNFNPCIGLERQDCESCAGRLRRAGQPPAQVNAFYLKAITVVDCRMTTLLRRRVRARPVITNLISDGLVPTIRL